MAGDWIPIRTNLHDDPAVAGISQALGIDEDAVVGKLLRLWSIAQDQSPDGCLPHLTREWVDQRVRCNGFACAMESVGWLSVRSTGIAIPEFDRWFSNAAKKRLQDSLRKRNVREMSALEADKNRTGILYSPKRGDLEKGKKGGVNARVVFVRPTVEQVAAYCFERGNTVDAQQFFDFYESKGWVVGKSRMKDWKASVRTWESNASKSTSNGHAKQSDLYSGVAEFLRRHQNEAG